MLSEKLPVIFHDHPGGFFIRIEDGEISPQQGRGKKQYKLHNLTQGLHPDRTEKHWRFAPLSDLVFITIFI